ncbi:pentatricopeptide repeat-containing protein At5g15280, mitochondrial [Argentina anserina]|uniref:pentatricopeptide repeat-containing protein At5g15280, mitochondrial n=1 Tax=Argentina anserina TaxID=57926 RepID=UPI002176871A|nr:pentatricopeptide repeat-containing protein At5g15280, mitochondrial [Potentilla anserina]
MKRSTTTIALYNEILQALSTCSPHKSHIKQVGSLYSLFSLFSTTTTAVSSPSSLTAQINNTQVDLSSNCFIGIAQSVILRCPQYFDKSKGKDFANASLKDLLLEISDLVPEQTRRLRRVSEPKPEDMLELLLGFQLQCGEVGFDARKVESLWGVFKWVSENVKGFKHKPQSCEVMASMLVRVGLLREVEFLLSTVESEGGLLCCQEIYSDLIEGYIVVGELDRAMAVYDRITGRVVPSLQCCGVLLDQLVGMRKTQLAFRVCSDMVEMGFDLRDVKKVTFEGVIRLLCRDGKIQEARDFVKKALAFRLKPNNLVLNEVAYGYCEKKDFDDLMSFYAEIKCAPEVVAGNRIMNSLCSNFGTRRAEPYLRELELLGFNPDEVTFGIMIGWSCRERKLKGALVYLSEMLGRHLNPHICTYNALISGVFMEGLWKHAGKILDEMADKGTAPDLMTFRILLAGYCKVRQFDEAKMIVLDMASHGLIQNSSDEDPLSKAFMVLGFKPLAVTLKRDNDVGFAKTEFYDDLGNGLYLDTDLDEYDKRITVILEDCMVPDYQSIMKKECTHGNLKGALVLADEMIRWGQDLSLSMIFDLLKGLSVSCLHTKEITRIVDKKLHLVNQLDQETLNFLAQAYGKKGLTYNTRIVVNGMIERHIKLNSETHTALIKGFCKKGNLRELNAWWNFAQNDGWLPGPEDCKDLIDCLLRKEMLREAMQLLESILISYPDLRSDMCHLILDKLSVTGCTEMASMLLDELEQRGSILDQMAYNNLIRGLCTEKNFRVAFTVLDSMLAKNLVPCLDVTVQLIPQLCRADRFGKAAYLREIGLREESSSSLSLDRALIEGCCISGKVTEATTQVQNLLLKGIHPDAEIYNFLVQGHCKVNDLKKVWELLSVMTRKSSNISLSSYRKLVHLMCLEGRVLHAWKLKDLMIGQCDLHDLSIYNILIFHIFPTGNTLLVKKLVENLQDSKLLLNEVTYNFLVNGFCRCKELPSAVNHLYTMISKDFRPSNRNLRNVITGLCDIGEIEKALELNRQMELRSWIHDSMIQNVISEGLLSCGRLQEAVKFLDRMVEKCLIPENVNYNNLIKLFCSYGRPIKAVGLLNIMLKKGNVPDSTSYDSIISSFCALDNLEQAMDFHAEMMDRKLNPSIETWDLLIHNFCRDGKTAEAERLLKSMVCSGETVTRKIYLSVISSYRSENNLEKVLELMQAMQQGGYEPDFETHWSLIRNLRLCSDKVNANSSKGFLSKLLSASGFSRQK